MFTAFFTRLLSILMSLLITLGALPATPTVNVTADADFSFTDDNAGSAAGTVTVTADYDGFYKLYWGDEDYEKLSMTAADRTVPYSEFVTVTVLQGKGSAELNEFLAIPDGAETVLLYIGEKLAGTEKLPESKLTDAAPVYRFGALSDLHFNRYSNDEYADIATYTFPTALDFLDAFDVTMVAMPGDISTNGERDAYEKFNSIVSARDFPVFTCKGNHDCYDEFVLSDWQELMNTGVYTEPKREGVLTVAENGLDFVYAGNETNGDVFIFFSQISADYILLPQLVTDAQLDWLAAQLETYKDKNVYLFFHTFLTAEGCQPNMTEGNLVNRAGGFYPLAYPMIAPDGTRFRELLKTYQNVVFFNGHSHWAYYMQKYNSTLNISDNGGTTATMVHVSSVSAPRTGTDYSLIWASEAGTMSEGLLVSVYPGYLVTTACDFTNNQFLAYATYRIDK